jgi:mannan endo-1,6-alpha-mannosidase
MMMYYHGNETGQTPGVLVEPYYWWEAGAMFGALIDYWRYTGDTTYNHIVSEAILWQASPERNFMPPNQSSSEGNDDQAFWAITALMAAENGFPDPPEEEPQWLALAQAVFNQQAARWDYTTTTCNGGLRWQISAVNRGYNYMNSITQGGFFNIAVRLGSFTNNQTYYDWADKMYAWCEQVGLISPTFQVFDGTDAKIHCSELDHTMWYVFCHNLQLILTANICVQDIQCRHLSPWLRSHVESGKWISTHP